MPVYTCVQACVRENVWVYVREGLCISVCMCACVHVSVCVCVCVYVRASAACVYNNIHAHKALEVGNEMSSLDLVRPVLRVELHFF